MSMRALTPQELHTAAEMLRLEFEANASAEELKRWRGKSESFRIQALIRSVLQSQADIQREAA